MGNYYMGIGIIFGAGSTVFLVWLLWYRHKTIKLLRRHQKEWDRIKENTPKELQFDAWCNYTDTLYNSRDPIIGACFPRY